MKHLVLSIVVVSIFPILVFGQDGNASEYENQAGINGAQNSAFGEKAGSSNKSKNNVFVGFESGAKNQGTNNVFVGSQSGTYNTKGANNVFLGYQSGIKTEDISNLLYIENSSSNKPLIWGDFKNDIANINGRLGVGNSNPQEALHINGNIRGNQQGGSLRINTTAGYIDIGPKNPSWAHIYTDRSKFIFNKDVYTITGGFSAYSNSDLTLKTNGIGRLSIKRTNGNVGIGTSLPDEKLTVKGKIHAQEVRVDLDGVIAPDYVFEKYFNGISVLNPDYNILSISEVETYVKANHHLPEIPSGKYFEENGMMLKEMNLKLLQKIEELTLYTIQQEKQIRDQGNDIEYLKNQLAHRLDKIDGLLKDLKQ